MQDRRPPLFRFEHVHLACRDLPAMESFLLDVLDGRLLRRRVTNGVLNVELDVGGGLIFLRDLAPGEFISDRPPPLAATLHHIGFEVTDLSAAIARFRRHGLSVLAGPFDWREDLAFAYVAGPEQLTVELLDRRPRHQRNAPAPDTEGAHA